MNRDISTKTPECPLPSPLLSYQNAIIAAEATIQEREASLRQIVEEARRAVAEAIREEREKNPIVRGGVEVVAPHYFGGFRTAETTLEKLSGLHQRLRAGCPSDEKIPLLCLVDYTETFFEDPDVHHRFWMFGAFDPAHLDAPFESNYQLVTSQEDSLTDRQGAKYRSKQLVLRSVWEGDSEEHGPYHRDSGLVVLSDVGAVSDDYRPDSITQKDSVLNIEDSGYVRSHLLVGWDEIESAKHLLGREELISLAQSLNQMQIPIPASADPSSPKVDRVKKALSVVQRYYQADQELRSLGF